MSDKQEKAEGISEGDFVGTRYRGGTREGYVEEVTADGKVKFTNQRGKEVTHRPETLARDPDRSKNPMPAEAAEKERQEWQQEMGGSR